MALTNALKGQVLNLRSMGDTVTVEWQQFFSSRSQTYKPCVYTLSENPVVVYIQGGYDIPEKLNVDSKLQYGIQSGILFFVYHDKSQKPFQHRFKSTTFEDVAKMGSEWLKKYIGGVFDPAAYVGEYLHDIM